MERWKWWRGGRALLLILALISAIVPLAAQTTSVAAKPSQLVTNVGFLSTVSPNHYSSTPVSTLITTISGCGFTGTSVTVPLQSIQGAVGGKGGPAIVGIGGCITGVQVTVPNPA